MNNSISLINLIQSHGCTVVSSNEDSIIVIDEYLNCDTGIWNKEIIHIPANLQAVRDWLGY